MVIDVSPTHTIPRVSGVEYSDGMKRLLPILLLVFSVGVGVEEMAVKSLKLLSSKPQSEV